MPQTDVKLDIFRGIKHRMVLNSIISAREHIGDSISSQVLQLFPGNYVKKLGWLHFSNYEEAPASWVFPWT